MVAGVALAFARGDGSDLHNPNVLVGAGQLDTLGTTMCRDAAVIQGVLTPPFPLANGVRKEMRRQALTRTYQLPDRFDAAAGAVDDMTGGVQFPAAELQWFWKGGNTAYLKVRGTLASENHLALNSQSD